MTGWHIGILVWCETQIYSFEVITVSKCNWCGKSCSGLYCSNKCQAEHSDHRDREHQKSQDEYRRLEILRAEQQIIEAKRVDELRLKEEQRLRDKALSLGITVDDVLRQEIDEVKKFNLMVLKVSGCVVLISMLVFACWPMEKDWVALTLSIPMLVLLYAVFSKPMKPFK
jgi:hypothetical protein